MRFEIHDTMIRGLAGRARTTHGRFDGRVPGPDVRVTQGDSVDFTLVNSATMPHSMDFHAAQIAPSKYYVNVMPNDSIHYRFVPRCPACSCTTAAPRRSRRTSPTACTAR